jgi:hypothetical protein
MTSRYSIRLDFLRRRSLNGRNLHPLQPTVSTTIMSAQLAAFKVPTIENEPMVDFLGHQIPTNNCV